jgi:rhodanese-related sulfurtransferase
MDALRVVGPDEARRLVDAGALLLDVREGEEWSAGRAPGASHVPLAELPDRLDDLDASRSVVCVCRSGSRSRRAALFLIEHGVDAANLEGGMIAWAEAGGPLESDGDEPTVV